jgi:hypothetical protein
MGRTTFEPLDSTTSNAQGVIIRVGTNQIGRYALHLHHLLGRPDNGRPYQFLVNHVAIDGSPKWGIAVHGSHFGVVTNNFVFDTAGGAIITEDPLEYGNNISDNLLVGYRDGSGLRMDSRAQRNLFGGDHWHNRVGLALQSAMNRIVGNRIYNMTEGIGMVGFRTTQLWWPTLRGVHTATKSSPGAVIWYQDPYRYPFVFDTSANQVWASWRGIETWTSDSYPDSEKMFPGLTMVHTHQGTNFQDQRQTTTYDWRFRGDFAKVSPTSGGGGVTDGNPPHIPYSVAFAFKGGYEFGHTHYRADVRGYDVGYQMQFPGSYSRFLGGRMEVATVVYQPLGDKNSVANTPWTGTWQGVDFVPVYGVPFEFVDGWYPKFDITLWLTKNDTGQRYLQAHRFEIRPWKDGRNLDVYHHFQSPAFRMPVIAAPDAYGDFPPGVYKNADLIARGTPIFGAAIPAHAEQLPEFPGFFVATAGEASVEWLQQRIAELEAALAHCRER